ncbi:restriction endonuclease subunit S [Gordonia lacunae]|uniref:restriction endonuclease subunit S n=1 Tax=Gordonia lacunae TaxID=417102 RepID=UPI0039E4485B
MTERKLPPGWARTTLGDVAEYVNGRGFKKSEWGTSGRPIIRIQNLTGSGSTFNYYAGEVLPKHIVKPNDLLVSWAATLSVHRWTEAREGALNQHIFKVTPSDAIDSGFLEHALRFAIDDMYQSAHGSGMVHVTRGKFESTEIPLPPLPEQHRIVEALDDHLSRLDVADHSIEEISTRIHILASKIRRHEFRADVAGPLQPLLSVCDVANGQTPKGLADASIGKVPFYKVGDMNGTPGRYMDSARTYLSDRAITSLGVKVRPAGTIVFPKRGGAIATNKKRILAKPSAYDLNTGGVTPHDTILPDYLWHWFESIDLGSISDGSNVPQINRRQLDALALPVPPVTVQQETIRRLDSAIEGLTVASRSLSTGATRSKALRRSILDAAFRGELVDQDPTDEPADVALGRIRERKRNAAT